MEKILYFSNLMALTGIKINSSIFLFYYSPELCYSGFCLE